MAETGTYGVADMETGDLSQFAGTVNEGSIMSAHADAKNNGSYGGRVLFDGTNNDCCGYFSPSNLTECYLRGYFYIDSGITIAAYAVLNIMVVRDGSNSVALVQLRRGAAGSGPVTQLRVTGVTGVTTVAITPILDQWFYTELHFVAGTGADGELEWWVDGLSKSHDTGKNFSAYAIDFMGAGGNFYGTGVPADGDFIYFDDVVAHDAYIGAYSAGGGTILLQIIMHHGG